MTFEFAHNFLRKLMNVEAWQLGFLTEAQQDNFFSNPHTFFIRADDETARQIWEVLYPKPKEPATPGVVVDLDAWRRRFEHEPKVVPLKYCWSPDVKVGGIPVVHGTATYVNPHKTYLVN